MSFASPQWLWLILILPVLYGIIIWRQRKRTDQFEEYARRNLWPTVAPELDPKRPIQKFRFWILGSLFLILTLARPQWGQNEEVLHVSGLDIFVALDVSNSMTVEDAIPSRIQKAKHLIRGLLDRLSGDRVGVVAFAASSFIASPLTNDLNYVRETIEVLGPRSVVNQGTDIGIALETSLKALQRGAEQVADADLGNTSKVILLITDGEDHEGEALPIARSIKESGIKLYVIGVGTEKGGPIPVRDQEGRLRGYKRGNDGKTVLSQFNPDSLIRLASEAGGRYWTATPAENEIDEMILDLGTLSRGDYAERRIIRLEERFQIPLALSILFFLIEMAIPQRKALVSRTLSLLVIGVFPFFLHAGQASAKLLPNSLEAYLENEEGVDALSSGDAERASGHFNKAKELNPDAPELEYNQGISSLKNGDSETASYHFDRAAKQALMRNQDDLAANALFNRGVAYAERGDAREALNSYLNALELAQKNGNAELEAEARKNIERLIQLEMQQVQAQKRKEQAKREDQKGEKEENQEEGSGSDKSDENEQPSGGQDEKNQKNTSGYARKNEKENFKSQNLSKEDADRVMKELSNRERELQKRMKRQRGNPSRPEKDW